MARNPFSLRQLRDQKQPSENTPLAPLATPAGTTPDFTTDKGTIDIRAIKRSVLGARSQVRSSALGELSNKGEPIREGRFQVGNEVFLDAVRKAEQHVRAMGGDIPGDGNPASFKPSRYEAIFGVKKDDVERARDRHNEALTITARNRGLQREASEANRAILAGRKSRSSVGAPRLPRGSGLLVPFRGPITSQFR